MHRTFKTLAIPLALIAAALTGAAPATDAVAPLTGPFAELAAKAEANQQAALVGLEGWLFLTAELRHLSVGQFWGEPAQRVSRAANKEAADPLPAIIDFHTQLQRAGIELVLLPVPAKAAVYPDKLLPLPGPTNSTPATEHQQTIATFCRMIAQQGLTVLDLGSVFVRARAEDPAPLYCRTDSHWSGRGCVVAADVVGRHVRSRAWFASVPKQKFSSAWRELEIRGDLVELAGQAALAPENLRVRIVTDARGAPPADSRESPVLLLGDSHTLVFHAGEDMHGTGGGLADQLALELGFSVDVVGVRGSGATPARINLLRRRDNLAGKKTVIWCFSVRELTEAPGGWRLVPVVGKLQSQ